jgi:hypothetical protein
MSTIQIQYTGSDAGRVLAVRPGEHVWSEQELRDPDTRIMWFPLIPSATVTLPMRIDMTRLPEMTLMELGDPARPKHVGMNWALDRLLSICFAG